MNSETKEDFISIFRSFFQIMNSEPEAIITDQQAAIIGALKEIKENEEWDGAHLLDTFHILKNLRKKTKNEALFDRLHQAMFEKLPGKYNEIM